MPPQVTSASIFNKIKGKAAQIHEKGVSAPIDYGSMGRLPAGIEGGVAVLDNIYLGEYKDGEHKGQPYLRAVGIVKLPHSVKVKGSEIVTRNMQTTLGPLPLCDTPNRKSKEGKPLMFNDNYLAALNAVQALRTSPGHTPERFPADQLPAILEQLKKDRPHFRFRTWKGAKRVIAQRSDGKWSLFNEDDNGVRTEYKDRQGKVPSWATQEAAQKANPWAGRDSLVNEVWNGRCEAPGEEGSHSEGIVDHDAGHTNGSAEKPSWGPPDDGAAEEPAAEAAKPAETGEASSGEQFSEFEDVGTLAATASETNDEGGATEEAEAAQLKLQTMAEQLGITEDELHQSADWEAVGNLILERQGGGSSEEGSGDESAGSGISVGDVVRYNPKNPKDGKPMMNPKAKLKDKDKRLWLECNVDSIDEEKGTLKLTALEDKKKKYTAKIDEVQVPAAS